MENPFEKKDTSIKVKKVLDKIEIGFYYSNEYNTLAFLEPKRESFNDNHILAYYKTSMGPIAYPEGFIKENFKNISLECVMENEANFKLELKWLVKEKVYNSFIEFLTKKEEFEILAYVTEQLKTLNNE